MDFRIADTFTASLARLTADEQKAVKTTAFDLQMNPAAPGMQFHRIDRSRDPNFWSVRVSRDIRIIVHRTEGSLMLCYVDHHDPAYAWAERRRIERHPRTGAAQLVEVRQTVREVEVPVYVEAEQPAAPESPKPPLFAGVGDDELLSYGVPSDWLADARAVDEDSLFGLIERLPQEAGEALLELATGGTPVRREAAPVPADPFAHPDAQRRFRVVTDAQELQRALDYPWEKWIVFLHPAQRELVERSYGGPARVSGSAGTGKTVVALHRAAHLARANPGANVLLTTFSIALARALRRMLGHLVGDDAGLRERITVRAIDEVGIRLYEAEHGKPKVATPAMMRSLIESASQAGGTHRFSLRFLQSEWTEVVDAWQLDSWEAYRDVARLGRKTRLAETQRAQLWSIFEKVRAHLIEQGVATIPMVFAAATEAVRRGGAGGVADFIVVDEAQDVGVPQLRLLGAMAGEREDGLFFAGDLGQRIFQTPFSWKSLGVDVRGRSQTLRINYRTSHQIRCSADRLLPTGLSDVDGVTETRQGTISIFNGPPPEVLAFDSADQECRGVAEWIKLRIEEGAPPHEVGVIVRSQQELLRAHGAVRLAGFPAVELSDQVVATEGHVAISTMHEVKGLEFRAVAVMACDDEVIPSQRRIDEVGDDADLEEVYNTERHLLYVACTRARDNLLVSGVRPCSEFLDDLLGNDSGGDETTGS